MSDASESKLTLRVRIADQIESWFAQFFHGHPAMRDTEAFNHIRRAVDELKSRLEASGPADSHAPAIHQEPSP